MVHVFKKHSIKTMIILFVSGIFFMGFNSQNWVPSKLEYSNWDALLKKHVSTDGKVDYKGFYSAKEKLTAFTDYLAENTPKFSWSENEKKAYLINAYNANTVRLIVEHYPINSIKDIAGPFSNVFKDKFIKYGNEKISLDDLEKNMLLPMGDARVHFAINCASKSCPKLANYAFKPEHLDQQLDEVTKAFINSSNVKVEEGQIYLSKIFKWYQNDFIDAAGSVINFVKKYAEHKIDSNAKVNYLEYSWALNGTNS